jgi:hypothetical protein
LVREGDKLLGQTVEHAEVLDMLFNLFGLGGGDSFGALFALKEAL